MPEPDNPDDYVRRGYAFYSRKLYKDAEADFKQAISLKPEAVDAVYALGMTKKAQGSKEEAINAFRQAIEMLESGVIEGRSRSEMLRRLALGHINEISIGDWNLEKEIWKRVE